MIFHQLLSCLCTLWISAMMFLVFIRDKYNGKILRIDVGPHTGDSPYWIPPDNPFLEPLPDGTYPLPEIYALGFRNPWRCGEDPGNRLTGLYGHTLCSLLGERGGSVVECRTPEREVRGSKPTAAVLCP